MIPPIAMRYSLLRPYMCATVTGSRAGGVTRVNSGAKRAFSRASRGQGGPSMLVPLAGGGILLGCFLVVTKGPQLADRYYASAQKAYANFCDAVGMPLMKLLDAESAHSAAILLASWGLAPKDTKEDDPILATRVMGLCLTNPVGLAAGFDKHAEAVDGLINTGFGFVEIGSVTPEPQDGNPKPRMFRLAEDQAVINRCGFNSHGVGVVRKRLSDRASNPGALRRGLVGVNVGKNKLSEDAAADYVRGILTLGCYGDYLVVNVSSPNTPGLRALQRRDAMKGIIKEALLARAAVVASTGKKCLPLLVKIAPDLNEEAKKDIAAVATEMMIDGLIVSNTTTARPNTLRSEHKGEGGGLSGAPLKSLSTQTVRDMYRLTKGEVPLIGVGGIATGADAYEKIRAGASLVQVYSMLVYTGPGAVPRIKEELAALLRRDGFRSVAEAVGADHPEFVKAKQKENDLKGRKGPLEGGSGKGWWRWWGK